MAGGEAINTTVTFEKKKKKKLKQDHRHTPALLLNTTPPPTHTPPPTFLLSTSTVSAASLTTSLSPQHSLTRTDTHLDQENAIFVHMHGSSHLWNHIQSIACKCKLYIIYTAVLNNALCTM